MSSSSFSFLRWAKVSAAGALLGFAGVVGGCSDVMVNTVQSRNSGIKQYNDGQYAEAAGTFRTTLRATPGDYGSHYFLGASLAKLGQYEQAVEQYKTCLEIMKDDLVGRDDRVFRLQCINSLADAAAASKDRDLQSFLVASAAPADNQFLMAKIDRRLGDADAALEAYSQASLLAPTDFDIIKEYGLYLLQLSQNDRARSELRRAYALNSKDEQIASALRRVGVVPGPSLKDPRDLAQPIIPVGPLPELDLSMPASDKGSKAGASVSE